MSKPIYIFAGGGTGGHLYPGLAVAERLQAMQPAARIVFACSNRAIDRRILDSQPHAVVPQPVRPMPGSARAWPGFLAAWRRSRIAAKAMIADLRPAAVLGLGGFAAAPVVCRAARAGVPAALLNPDAVPGKANRFLAARADAIFTQFDAAREHFPAKLRARVRCVGCPVRRSLLSASRDQAGRHFGLRDDRKTLLVNGGSLGARSVNEAVLALLDDLGDLAGAWQVLHVTGRASYAETAARWDSVPIGATVIDYCDRMDLAYAAADLALGRGGACSIAELAATATPAVVMPYPHHKDRQQHLNAAALAGAGAAVVVEDRGDAPANAAALRETLLPIMADAERLETMRRSAAACTKPNAAETVAQWLLDHAQAM